MSRIGSMFGTLRAAGQTALIPFFTAGDPDLDLTADLVRAAVDAGADAIELGVPFSDPMADGPVLQRAAGRALAGGTTLTGILGLVSELRRDVTVPIILFGYYNPFFRYGVDAIARDAAAAGADGFLCVDLPPEEAAPLRAASQASGTDLIYLLAPTTPASRIRMIARHASGFLYFVSVLGVTGGRSDLPRELPGLVKRVRALTDLPLGVGFGVQRPDQAAWIAGFADAVIVGSAIAALVEDGDRVSAPARIGAFVRDLRAATRDGRQKRMGAS